MSRSRTIAVFLAMSLLGAAPTTRPAPPLDVAAMRRAAAESRSILDRNTAGKLPAYTIELGRPRRFEASLAYVAAAPQLIAREWVVIGAMPPEFPGQRDVRVTATPAPAETKETGGLVRGMLVWRIKPADPATRLVTIPIEFTMELRPRLLRSRPAGAGPVAEPVPPLAPAEQKAFTASGTLADFETPAFQAWIEEKGFRPKGNETEVDFARRVFLAIKAGGKFEFLERMDRRASVVCNKLSSDCGGLTAVFVATMRACGVPARQMVGRWAQPAKAEEKLAGREWHQEHVKAEFFAAGVGWVPVEVSAAVAYDRVPGGLSRFGRDNGDFVTLHIDPDLRVDTIHFGQKTVTLLQEPVFWVSGEGSMTGATARSDWRVAPAGVSDRKPP